MGLADWRMGICPNGHVRVSERGDPPDQRECLWCDHPRGPVRELTDPLDILRATLAWAKNGGYPEDVHRAADYAVYQRLRDLDPQAAQLYAQIIDSGVWYA
jgi:hypothetical protein